MNFFFIFVLAVMLTVTSWASIEAPVTEGIAYLTANRWGIATLCDTYFAFFTVYLWMAYKEPSTLKRVVWLIAVVLGGTIAVAVFFLHELYMTRGQSIEAFLLRRPNAAKGTL
jgi:hypothetical protein